MVKVKVSQGWLEGQLLDLVTGDGQYYSFKGVPYAEPPIGKLRFKAPRPPLPWNGVRKALEHAPTCPQYELFSPLFTPGNEDCLYLNVYTRDLTPKTPLPVMVFIHGGAFRIGSGNVANYGPDFLVNHGVLLVTINYRLDALGFLCLDTKDVPGNAGLKDQTAALRWIKENISQFGGDASNITVFGESAGGSSVVYHVVSPLSKGLFHRAIAMSGVPDCDFAVSYRARDRAFLLGKLLGIETKDPEELLDFLQKLPVEKLLSTKPTIISSEEIADNFMKLHYFTPVVEKTFDEESFLSEPVFEALANGRLNDVDVFIGHTSDEALMGTKVYVDTLIPVYNRHLEMLAPRKLQVKCNPDTILDISEKIRKFYFNDKAIDNDTIKEFLKYIDDSCFVYDIHRFARKLPKTGNKKRYFYRFSCHSERNVFGKEAAPFGIHGASHMDDLMYLFDSKSRNLPLVKDSKEYELIKLVNTVFTNFAKYGTPTPDESLGLTWPEYNASSRLYVDIGDQLTAGADLDADIHDFWKDIFTIAGVEF